MLSQDDESDIISTIEFDRAIVESLEVLATTLLEVMLFSQSRRLLDNYFKLLSQNRIFDEDSQLFNIALDL